MEFIRGKVKKPFNVIFYGEPTIGKSTWASKAPRPLFLGKDDTGELSILRGTDPETWPQFLAQVHDAMTIDLDAYDTLVIDTIDSIEMHLVHPYVISLDRKGAATMDTAHGGYRRAYSIAFQEFLKFQKMLVELRDKHKKNIIILGHSRIGKGNDAAQEQVTYDKVRMSIETTVEDLFVNWVSCVLYGFYKNHKVDDDNSDKVFVKGTGQRIIRTEKRPQFLAKNRFDLPYEMSVSFDEFYQAYNDFFADVNAPGFKELYVSCLGLAENIQNEVKKTEVLEKLFSAREDVNKLKVMKQRLQEMVGG